MAPKIFLTGATGYIGGDALYEIVNAHPELEITALVRNSDKGAKVVSQHPKIRLVYGDLDSVDLIEEEVSKVDIVYHFADCDHLPSAEAIARGLARRQGSEPGYWIHTSGTAILGWETIEKKAFGEVLPKVYNDWSGVSELTSLPDGAPHRHVDRVVLAASQAQPDRIKTAIVAPPCINGKGRGQNPRSAQVYNSTKAFLEHGQAWTPGKGENIWHEVHVQDLSKLYLLLGEAAINGGSPATWNDHGYYLAENGSFKWADVMQAVAKEAHKQGVLPSAETKELSVEEGTEMLGDFFTIGLASNSRGESIRGKKLLGWQPKESSLFEMIPAIVEGEAKSLGLIKGHAEMVT